MPASQRKMWWSGNRKPEGRREKHSVEKSFAARLELEGTIRRNIVGQLKKTGPPAIGSGNDFTMDPVLRSGPRGLRSLHQDGLLYRGERLINWCPRCLTALSDIEVEHEEITGKLYTIRYHLVDDPTQFLLVATTRPETCSGIRQLPHPEDERFRHLIGKHVRCH